VTLSDVQARLLLEPNPAIITTLRKDGSAHSTLGWVDWDGEFVLINTVVGRLKERHLRRDDRITVCVVDRTNINRYIGVEGRVTLTTEGADQQVNRMSHDYLGKDFVFKPGMVRILAKFQPERVWGIYDDATEDELKSGRDWEQSKSAP
jgi:PPOX class probable F420-dependent enzyme